MGCCVCVRVCVFVCNHIDFVVVVLAVVVVVVVVIVVGHDLWKELFSSVLCDERSLVPSSGSEWVDPEDPTVIAETELLGAAASIEAAAKKLEQLKPRAKPKVGVRQHE